MSILYDTFEIQTSFDLNFIHRHCVHFENVMPTADSPFHQEHSMKEQ